MTRRRNDRDRGRWSAPNAESVDLDTLLEAPSPPPPRRRRKKCVYRCVLCLLPSLCYTNCRRVRSFCCREKSLSSISEHFHPQSRGHAASSALPPRHHAKPRRNRGRAGSRRKSAPPPEDEPPMYHSYEDPGYLAGDPVDLQPFDCDAILGSPINSPLNSPSVIHARWGEPVDDPDEENVCTDFRPNPFKLGFCVNCQKQHDVDADGEVVAMKEYKKIARPTIAKYAANALDLPDAVPPPTRASISHLPEGGRESDIDLAQLLTQRREVLMRLNQIESQSKQQQQQRRKPPSSGAVPTMRHSTMFFGDTSNGSLAEQELLALLKARGVTSLCAAVGREINYAWAVQSGFKTLASVGHFYFACGEQSFGYNPGSDFFAANGLQLAVFALHKFVHNEHVLVPALDSLDISLLYAILDFSGIPRLVEAVAAHLDTEEVAVEGFQLLERLAALPEASRAVNDCKVLDLAYVALFAYSGPVHRHTRLAIKGTLHSFHKCALYDPRELARRERSSRGDIARYVLLLLCFVLNSALALYDQQASDTVFAVRRAVVDAPWDVARPSLSSVSSISDVWDFLQGPVQSALFQDTWYNGDSFSEDVDLQLGVVDRANLLLGGVELRLLRVDSTASCTSVQTQQLQRCYPSYSLHTECKTNVANLPFFEDQWTSSSTSESYTGQLSIYPSSGYRRFLPRLTANNSANATDCDPRCELDQLRRGLWLDASSRALFLRLNLYNFALDLHCVVQLLFEFDVGGDVVASAEVTPLHLNQYPGLFIVSPRFLTELGLLVGVVWLGRQQLEKLLQYRHFYFIVASHVVDLAIVALWTSVLVLRLQSVVQTAFPLLLTIAETSDSSVVDLQASEQYLRTERLATAVCAVLMWWRLVRLAKSLKPLERTLEKLERAQVLLQSYVALLVVYVLGFAHTGVLLFPSARGSFRSFATAWTLATRWHPMDLTTDRLDHQLFRLLFQFATTFVVLKLRAVAARGATKLHKATRELLAVNEEPEQLSDLKKAWGLGHRLAEADDGDAEGADEAPKLLAPKLLAAAEEYERQLDHQLGAFSSRLDDMLGRLGQFQGLLGDELGQELEIETQDEVEELEGTSGREEQETRPVEDHFPPSDIDHSPAKEEEPPVFAGLLPGAINSSEEQEDEEAERSKQHAPA
ncbi:hypothetical protein BBJ28_00020597 [Nothophytophthora sp. Chile5]|nr:hypothetical protein BBJ28_00020597 [Nothophytophthora sp. Chile5]